ncbi:MAG: HAMP domain-containing histidine kinase [Sterolibacteriaceae bacterium MAG5]|nr:HAMP domain-containing histidine kinase [Candidatus Nitricoxidireducens bremensis]
MNSLRHKIILGYALVGALVIALSLFTFLELRLLEEKIGAGEKVGELFEVCLEVRRFEKNYFLYGQSADLSENRAYASRARELLRTHGGLFADMGDPLRVRRLGEELERYETLMGTYARAGGPEAIAGEIRKSGKDIVTIAEHLAQDERKTLQTLLDRHRRILIGAVIGVALLVVGIGQLLSRRVARPLKQMEASMAAVAAGRTTALDMPAEDREIASLTQAFNRMLREIELRQGQLVRSEKLAALGTLLSGVAHELNNPLSNIATSTQILLEELDAEEEGAAADPAFRRELLDQINGETWRARRIVRSLLDYARDRDFAREPLALAALAEETLRLIRGQIPTRVAVRIDIPEELTLAGDKQRLQQVILNLVRNAVEAVEGAGEVVLQARPVAAGSTSPPGRMVFGQCPERGAAVEIEVRDDGHGIAAEVLPKIFDPFFSTKEVGRGLGLGLFIVFEIIEEHGGCIAVASEPGCGTAFFLRLPAAPPPSPSPGEAHA